MIVNAVACTFDEIPSLTDIEVTYALPARPKKVIRLPENRPVDFTYKDNKLHFTVDRLESILRFRSCRRKNNALRKRSGASRKRMRRAG